MPGVMQGPDELFTMRKTREIAERAGGGEGAAPDISGPVTTSAEIEAAKKSLSFDDPAVQLGFKTTLGMFAPPVATMLSATTATLGGLASMQRSLEEGVLGDIAGTRSMESERDVAEEAGYTRSMSERAAKRGELGSTSLGDQASGSGGESPGEAGMGEADAGGGGMGRGGFGAEGPSDRGEGGMIG